MTVGQYLITSGIAGPSEQDTLDRLDEFMTGALGWNRVAVVTDDTSDNDRVWYSAGEVPGKYSPMYVRVRATNNDIRFQGYTLWDSGTGNDEIANTTELQIPNDNDGGPDEYVFVGNKDVVFVVTRLNSNSSNYMGGFGYWDTFYTPQQDPYPLWVMGQNVGTDNFNNTHRVMAYGFDPDGFLHTGSTISGGAVGFVAQDLGFLTGLATPNPRDGRHLMLKSSFYRERSRPGAGGAEGTIPGTISHEIRGEIPALFQFYGSNFASNDRVVASGVSVGDGIPGDEVGLGNFVVSRGAQSNTFALGPVQDYSPTPPTINDLELWLHGGAAERRLERVREWIDLSGNSRHSTQNTVADRPRPLVSGTDTNSQPYVSFNNSDYLTGSLEVVNGYTVFVVAEYTVEDNAQPLFHIGGAINTSGTIFSVGFNTDADNSAQLVVQTDDSPLEEDKVRYTGLSAHTWYVVSALVSGTDTTLYVNGDSGGSSTIANTKTTIVGSTVLNYGIGTALDSSGDPAGQARHEGGIAEAIVYTRNLTNEEHQSIICYLGDKYNITVAGTC